MNENFVSDWQTATDLQRNGIINPGDLIEFQRKTYGVHLYTVRYLQSGS